MKTSHNTSPLHHLALVLNVDPQHPVAQRLTSISENWGTKGTSCAQFRDGHYSFRTRKPEHLNYLINKLHVWCFQFNIPEKLSFL